MKTKGQFGEGLHPVPDIEGKVVRSAAFDPYDRLRIVFQDGFVLQVVEISQSGQLSIETETESEVAT